MFSTEHAEEKLSIFETVLIWTRKTHVFYWRWHYFSRAIEATGISIKNSFEPVWKNEPHSEWLKNVGMCNYMCVSTYKIQQYIHMICFLNIPTEETNLFLATRSRKKAHFKQKKNLKDVCCVAMVIAVFFILYIWWRYKVINIIQGVTNHQSK